MWGLILILAGYAHWDWFSPSLGLHLFKNEMEVIVHLIAIGEIMGFQTHLKGRATFPVRQLKCRTLIGMEPLPSGSNLNAGVYKTQTLLIVTLSADGNMGVNYHSSLSSLSPLLPPWP